MPERGMNCYRRGTSGGNGWGKVGIRKALLKIISFSLSFVLTIATCIV